MRDARDTSRGLDTENERGQRGCADRRRRVGGGLLALLLAAAPAATRAAEFQVDSFADLPDIVLGDGACRALVFGGTPVCTLRAAIQEANALGTGHVIRLEAGTYRLTRTGEHDQSREDALLGTLDPGLQSDMNDLDLLTGVTIQGAGRDATFIDGGGRFRVLKVLGSEFVRLRDLTLQNGKAPGPYLGGGGLYVALGSVAILERVALQDNESHQPGGGARSGGFLELNDSVVRRNEAAVGGGLFAERGSLKLIDSVVTGNVASGPGGITYGRGGPYVLQGGSGGGIATIPLWSSCVAIDVRTSTISHNQGRSSVGGGIAAVGSLRVWSSTISGNESRLRAGGVYYLGDPRCVGGPALDVQFSTIVENRSTAASAAGLHVVEPFDGRLRAVLLARNLGRRDDPANCSGDLSRITETAHNLDDDGSCGLSDPTDLSGVAADLGPLADNGGPTPTHALRPGPAIDGGGPSGPPLDQRGSERPQGRAWDVGAYEAEAGGSDSMAHFQVPVPPRVDAVRGFAVPVALRGALAASIVDVIAGDAGGEVWFELSNDGRSAVVHGRTVGLQEAAANDRVSPRRRPVLFTVVVRPGARGQLALLVSGGEVDATLNIGRKLLRPRGRRKSR